MESRDINNSIFRLACASGHLEEAKQMYGFGDVDIHACGSLAFQGACKNGRLEIAKWLYGLDGVNIHEDNDLAFQWACVNGRLEIAQWLHGLGGGDIHSNNDLAFRWACEKGHLETAQWLYSLGGVDIHANNDCVFHLACKNDHFEIAQWLFSLDNPDHNKPLEIADSRMGELLDSGKPAIIALKDGACLELRHMNKFKEYDAVLHGDFPKDTAGIYFDTKTENGASGKEIPRDVIQSIIAEHGGAVSATEKQPLSLEELLSEKRQPQMRETACSRDCYQEER